LQYVNRGVVGQEFLTDFDKTIRISANRPRLINQQRDRLIVPIQRYDRASTLTERNGLNDPNDYCFVCDYVGLNVILSSVLLDITSPL
jgi:hypothetical protein